MLKSMRMAIGLVVLGVSLTLSLPSMAQISDPPEAFELTDGQKAMTLTLSPNPATTQVTITIDCLDMVLESFETSDKDAGVSIIDLAGSEITFLPFYAFARTENRYAYEWPVNVDEGVYLVHAVLGEYVRTKRLVVKR
jgi:hypothetical protein